MHSFNIKSLAIVASSLLVKEVFAAPIYATEVQVVTEEVTVTKNADGSFVAGPARPIATSIRKGAAAPIDVVVVPTPAPSPEVKVPSSATADGASAKSFSSSPSGGKRGVAYNTASFVSAFTGSSKVSWASNWGSRPYGDIPPGFEFVPLLWGMKSTSTWNADASSAIASGSKHLMSFNEPDHSGQANLAPADAAAAYKQYMQPFAGKAKLGAPAVTNGGAPMGLDWLSRFMSACSDCTIDFVCIHWYDSASNVQYFKNHITEAYKAGGNRPLWITEFQAFGTTDQQIAFMKEVLPWLDASDMVDRYSWFMANSDAGGLMSGNDLSALGNSYKTI